MGNRDGERSRKGFDPQRVSRIFHQMISLLCDFPDEIEVSIWNQSGNGHIIFEVIVDERDYGKVIGKSGKTATALRTLMGATAGNHDQNLSLEFSFKTV